MSTSNPTLLHQNTRFRPAPTRSQSCSPCRSPVRKAQFTEQEIDPLLGNLSPTSTLKALSLTEALRTNTSKDADILARSIAETSTDERAYGIRAALAAQKLREWHAEILGWKWPAKKERRLGKGFQQRSTSSPEEQTRSPKYKHKEYLGILPTAVVAQHEERIEQIKDGLEALDVEGLKVHVLSTHVPPRSKDGTVHGSHDGVMQLSDFTAVVTHTMLQALPYLSKLTALLSDWDIRIIVLKQIPRLLRQLKMTESAIESALDQVYARRTSELLARTRFDDTKGALGGDISLLGATFDKLLDLLEGREDSLPETWIEMMDKIETSFAQWTVEAERRVLYNEWMEQNRTSMLERHQKAPSPTSGAALTDITASCANYQARSSTACHERIRHENPVELKPETPPSGDAIRMNQQRKSDEHNIPSAIALEPQTLVGNTPPFTSLPSDGPRGMSVVGKPHSFVSAIATPDLAIQSQAREDTREESPIRTPQDPEASLIVPRLPATGRTLSSIAPAESNEEEAYQPRKLAASTSDDVEMSTTHPVQGGDAPLEYLSLLTDRFLQEHHSDIRGFDPGSFEPVSEILDQSYSRPPDHQRSSLISGPQVKQPLLLNLPPTNHRRETSNMSLADSMLSEAFSDLSNAEIVHATTAEALGSPRVVSHHFRPSRGDLSDCFMASKPRIQARDLPGDDMQPSDSADKVHKKAAIMSFDKIKSTFTFPIKTPDTIAYGEDDADPPERITDPSTPHPVSSHRTVIHRASISSVEKIPKNRVRSIIVVRRDSSSSSIVSAISPLDTSVSYARPGSAMSVSSLERQSSISRSKNSSRRDYFEGVGRKEESSSITNGRVSQLPGNHVDTPGVPRRSSRRLARGPIANLAPTLSTDTRDLTATPKTYHGPQDAYPVLRGFSTSPSLVNGHDNSEYRTPSKGKGKGREDLLEAKIQHLLSRIPGRIRLLSDSDTESTHHSGTASSSRSPSPIPSIILSPVKSKRRPQPNNGTPNSEVRLFHLTRSTEAHNAPPTKLFVRLVGEHGERVMVRVGGGWADLGDYLRDYSLHHSSRTLNSSQFELASLPASGRKDNRVIPIGPELISKARGAGPSSSKIQSLANSRPGSAMDHRPSAITPFEVLRPTRSRRSASATARQESDAQNFSSPSLPYASSSDVDSIDTDSYTPPVPAIPQVVTLNPQFGGDPRFDGPPRPQPGVAASSNSPLTPTPATTSFQQPLPKSSGVADAGTGTSAKSNPNSSHGAGAGADALTTTRTRSRPIIPAASRIALNIPAGAIPGEAYAPAPVTGSTYSSSPTSPKSSSSGRMSSSGDGGGIRRVFFRKKTAA